MEIELQREPTVMKAYAVTEMEKWGCPKCGYRSGSSNMSCGGAQSWRCGECGDGTIVLNDGMTRTPPSWVDPVGELVPHPRSGTPSHGKSDKRPPEGGEFFSPRGIGMDRVPACFVCGRDQSHNYSHNIAAFVQCKEAGERLVVLFEGRARLDYRDFEPDRIQLKIGVCDTHEKHLEELDKRTSILRRIDKDILSSIIRGDTATVRHTVMRLKRGKDDEPRAPGADWEPVLSTLDVKEVKRLSEIWNRTEWGFRVDMSLE